MLMERRLRRFGSGELDFRGVFLSVASPTATQPNGLMNLAYIGAFFFGYLCSDARSETHLRRTEHRGQAQSREVEFIQEAKCQIF